MIPCSLTEQCQLVWKIQTEHISSHSLTGFRDSTGEHEGKRTRRMFLYYSACSWWLDWWLCVALVGKWQQSTRTVTFTAPFKRRSTVTTKRSVSWVIVHALSNEILIHQIVIPSVIQNRNFRKLATHLCTYVGLLLSVLIPLLRLLFHFPYSTIRVNYIVASSLCNYRNGGGTISGFVCSCLVLLSSFPTYPFFMCLFPLPVSAARWTRFSSSFLSSTLRYVALVLWTPLLVVMPQALRAPAVGIIPILMRLCMGVSTSLVPQLQLWLLDCFAYSCRVLNM